MKHERIDWDAHKALDIFETIKAQLVAIGSDDEESLISAAGSETNILDLYKKMLIQDAELDAQIEALKGLIELYQRRKSSAERRKQIVRGLIATVLDALEQKSIPTEFGTAGRTLLARSIKIVSEPDIPDKYWQRHEPVTPPPTLKVADLTKFALDRQAERDHHVAFARSIYEKEIIAACAYPEGSPERIAALEAIDLKLAPDMDRIDEHLPMPGGIEIEPERFSLTIRRGKVK